MRLKEKQIAALVTDIERTTAHIICCQENLETALATRHGIDALIFECNLPLHQQMHAAQLRCLLNHLGLM